MHQNTVNGLLQKAKQSIWLWQAIYTRHAAVSLAQMLSFRQGLHTGGSMSARGIAAPQKK